MSSNEAYKCPLLFEIEPHYQAVLIPLDIEYYSPIL